MCGISKKIELVKELYAKKDKDLWQSFHDFTIRARDSIMPIIAELETANKRIAELEKLLKRVEPMAASGLYREITEVLYVVKEQTNE